MGFSTDQELNKRAIPIESDHWLWGHLETPFPVIQQGFSRAHPFRIDKLMPARLPPGPPQVKTQRQPKPAEACICENKPRQARFLYDHPFRFRFHGPPLFLNWRFATLRLQLRNRHATKNSIVFELFALG